MSTCSFFWTTAQVDLGNDCSRVFSLRIHYQIIFPEGAFSKSDVTFVYIIIYSICVYIKGI